MKVNIKGKLAITITEINVEDGEYEIHYEYSLDDGPIVGDMYGGDYEGWSKKEWLETLKYGEAIKIVTQKIANNL